MNIILKFAKKIEGPGAFYYGRGI